MSQAFKCGDIVYLRLRVVLDRRADGGEGRLVEQQDDGSLEPIPIKPEGVEGTWDVVGEAVCAEGEAGMERIFYHAGAEHLISLTELMAAMRQRLQPSPSQTNPGAAARLQHSVRPAVPGTPHGAKNGQSR